MKITRAGDYALRALSYIARKDPNKVYMRSELSESCGIPDSFLGKILQSLAKSKILVSERGKKGGFKLNRYPKDISIYDIIKSIEGEVMINECLLDKSFCDNFSYCKIHQVLGDIRNTLIEDMKRYTLEDII
jgi:Rrf2 family protein